MIPSALILYIDKALAEFLTDPQNKGLHDLLLETETFVSSLAQGFTKEKALTALEVAKIPTKTLEGAKAQELEGDFSPSLQSELKEALLCGATIFGTTDKEAIEKEDILRKYGLSVANPEKLLHVFTPATEI